MGLLSYRDNVNLKQVAEACRKQGAEVVEFDENVTNEEGMQHLIWEFDDEHPLDLVCVKDLDLDLICEIGKSQHRDDTGSFYSK